MGRGKYTSVHRTDINWNMEKTFEISGRLIINSRLARDQARESDAKHLLSRCHVGENPVGNNFKSSNDFSRAAKHGAHRAILSFRELDRFLDRSRVNLRSRYFVMDADGGKHLGSLFGLVRLNVNLVSCDILMSLEPQVSDDVKGGATGERDGHQLDRFGAGAPCRVIQDHMVPGARLRYELAQQSPGLS